MSDTRLEESFVTGIVSRSDDILYETEGTTCYGYWVLWLLILDTRQEVRFVTGIGFYIL